MHLEFIEVLIFFICLSFAPSESRIPDWYNDYYNIPSLNRETRPDRPSVYPMGNSGYGIPRDRFNRVGGMWRPWDSTGDKPDRDIKKSSSPPPYIKPNPERVLDQPRYGRRGWRPYRPPGDDLGDMELGQPRRYRNPVRYNIRPRRCNCPDDFYPVRRMKPTIPSKPLETIPENEQKSAEPVATGSVPENSSVSTALPRYDSSENAIDVAEPRNPPIHDSSDNLLGTANTLRPNEPQYRELGTKQERPAPPSSPRFVSAEREVETGRIRKDASRNTIVGSRPASIERQTAA